MNSIFFRRFSSSAFCVAVVVLTLGTASLPSAFAQIRPTMKEQDQQSKPVEAPPPTTEGDVVRESVGKILNEAQALISAQKPQDALAKLKEADAIANKTPFENFTLDRVRGVAAARAGDTPTAIKSFETVIAANKLPPPEQLKLVEVLTQLYYSAKEYPKAAAMAQRYIAEGGADPQTRSLRARSLYLAEDYKAAASELKAQIDADEKAGAKPTLQQLQLYASIFVKTNDDAGYKVALEKLLVHYPSKDYWNDAIYRMEQRDGFASRYRLDVLRLRDATGSLSSASQYAAMVQLSLNALLPGEAKRIADRGFQLGLLGVGPDAELEKKLRDQANKQAAEDEKLLAKGAADGAKAKDGTGLVNVGFAYVSVGQYDKGIPLMEQGLQKGGVQRPEDVKLHLAIAYLAAGQKDKAIATFKEISGTDGAADLAHLWLIQAQRQS